MRLFQIGHIYPSHVEALSPALARCTTWTDALATIVADSPKCHLLLPCLEGSDEAFLSYVAEPRSLRLWARERGMPGAPDLKEIVLAQIEEHGSEVLYCMHGSALDPGFLDGLPGSVRKTVVWLGSPLVGDAYGQFDLIVSNFPSLNRANADRGLEAAFFSPSHDPSFDTDVGAARDLDVVFVGGYTRHHRRRAELLHALALREESFEFTLHLDNSRYTRLAETTPLGLFPPFSAVRRPRAIRRVARPPVFGQEMFDRLRRAKIVVNGSIDMFGSDRGNIRCFETLSAGALLVSDAGDYPDGFIPGETFDVYDGSPDDAVAVIEAALGDEARRRRIAASGHGMIRERYSKERQWAAFQALL